jgi:hypothetical protein
MTMPIPFVQGSETSEEAADAKGPTATSDEGAVLALLWKRGTTGATDDEIEVALGMLHQNASARRNALVRKGLVCDSGLTRKTRSGRRAAVWIVGSGGNPLIGASNDMAKRPNRAEMRAAADLLETQPGMATVVVWLRWLARH